MQTPDSDFEFIQQLAQAPPEAPRASDKDAAQASADSAAASKAASALAPVTNPVAPAASAAPVAPAARYDSGTPKKPAFDATVAPPGWLSDLDKNPGSFGWHLANSVTASLADPKTAELMSQPTGLMRAITLGGLHALGKVGEPARPPEGKAPASGPWSTAVTNADATQPTTAPPPQQGKGYLGQMMASLGDSADNSGMAGTAAARTKRLSEEQKDRALQADSNARLLHEQSLLHKSGEDAINQSVEDGKKGRDAIINPIPGGVRGSVDFTGKTSDELNLMIKQGQLDPTLQTVFPVGRVLVGKDPNGLAMYRTVYDVVTPAKNVSVDPENAKLLNENLGRNYPVDKDPTKQQVLPGVQFNAELQAATSAKAAMIVAKHAQVQLGIEAERDNDTVASRMVPQMRMWQSEINKQKSGEADPFATVKAFHSLYVQGAFTDPKSEMNGMQDAVKIHIGGSIEGFNRMDEEYSKAQAKNDGKITTMIQDFRLHPEKIEGHTSSVIAATQAVINDPTKSPQEKADALSLLAQAKATQAGELQLENQKETLKKKTASAQDVAATARMIRRGDQDPSQLSKRGATFEAIKVEADRQEMEETGKHFNIAQASTDYKQANNPQVQATLKMVDSIAEQGGLLDIVKDRASKLPQSDLRIANKLFSGTKSQFGDPALTDFQTSMLDFADMYSKVMGGGVSSDTARQQALNLLKSGYSKGQMGGAIQTLEEGLAARKRGIIGKNRYLINQFGDPNAQQPTHHPDAPIGSRPVLGANGEIIGYSTDNGKTMRPVVKP